MNHGQALFMGLVKTLQKDLTMVKNKKFKNEKVYLDFYHHNMCTFDNCELVINYGIYKLIRNKFNHCKFTSESDSPARGVLELDRVLKEAKLLRDWK